MGAPADPLILSQRSRIVRFAVEHRIPAMYEFRGFVSDGGLLSYGPNLMEMFRRSAGYVDKILKGAKPADLPVEQASKFELVVNLKTAKALRLTIPPSFRAPRPPAEAQPTGKVYRIGYLAMFPAPPGRESFLQGLRDLGWIEGQNITIEYRYAHGRLEQLPDLVAELVRLKVDLIVAVSPQPVQAAKEATTTVPIVMVAVADPVTYGFVTMTMGTVVV